MRFKVDENLPVDVVRELQSYGHDAVGVVQQGLGGARDRDLFAVCKTEGRVLITLDVGFANIGEYPPGSSPGTIVLRLSRQNKAHVLSVVRRFVKLLGLEPLEGRLWVVEDERVRIRE